MDNNKTKQTELVNKLSKKLTNEIIDYSINN